MDTRPSPLPRIASGLALTLLLAACEQASPPAAPAATPAAPRPAAPAAPTPAPTPAPASTTAAIDANHIVLAAGQWAEFAPGWKLHYVALTNDSRCPAGAQCAWAGEVRLAMALESGNGRTDFELASGNAPTARVQRKQVTLLDFGPCPANAGGGECATLRVGR